MTLRMNIVYVVITEYCNLFHCGLGYIHNVETAYGEERLRRNQPLMDIFLQIVGLGRNQPLMNLFCKLFVSQVLLGYNIYNVSFPLCPKHLVGVATNKSSHFFLNQAELISSSPRPQTRLIPRRLSELPL